MKTLLAAYLGFGLLAFVVNEVACGADTDAAEANGVGNLVDRLIDMNRLDDAHDVLRLWIEAIPNVSPDERWRRDALHGALHRHLGRRAVHAGRQAEANVHFGRAEEYLSQAQLRIQELRKNGAAVDTMASESVDLLLAAARLSLAVRGHATTRNPLDAAAFADELRNLDVLLDEKATQYQQWADGPQRERLLGQAYYLRAYAQRHLDPIPGGRVAAAELLLASARQRPSREAMDLARQFGEPYSRSVRVLIQTQTRNADPKPLFDQSFFLR